MRWRHTSGVLMKIMYLMMWPWPSCANTVVNMRRLLVKIDDMQARGNLMWDSAMAENGILKVGRLTDFQAHQIETSAGRIYGLQPWPGPGSHPSGILPSYPEGRRSKIHPFCNYWYSGKDTAQEGLDALTAFIQECGLPTRLRQLKIQGGDHRNSAAQCGRYVQPDQICSPCLEARRDL